MHAFLHCSEGHQLTWLSLTHLDRRLLALLFPASMVPLLALTGRSCPGWKLESLVFEKERGPSDLCCGHNGVPEFHSNHLAFGGRGIMGDPTEWYQEYRHRAQCDFQEGLEEGKGGRPRNSGGKLSAARNSWLYPPR